MAANRTVKQSPLEPDVNEEWWAALLADEEKFGNVNNIRLKKEEPVHEIKETVTGVTPKKQDVDWDFVQRLYSLDEPVELFVSSCNRGGLLVDGESLHGFVPVSHLVDIPCDIEEDERNLILEGYIGQRLSLKVIECDPAKGRIVFSERAAQASKGRRNQLMDELKPDTCVRGVVTNITDFGVFVDLGGVEGLIHVSEISWGRVNHPADVVQVGQEITAYILGIDKDRSRIALSLKRLCANPWETVEQRYIAGQVVDVLITCVVPFGAFARIEDGLDGLIHITEMGLEEGRSPSDILSEGDWIQARILHIDPARQRLGLSLAPMLG